MIDWMQLLSSQVTIKQCTYLHQMDESGEDGTAKHVVFLGLLPQQRKVLN